MKMKACCKVDCFVILRLLGLCILLSSFISKSNGNTQRISNICDRCMENNCKDAGRNFFQQLLCGGCFNYCDYAQLARFILRQQCTTRTAFLRHNNQQPPTSQPSTAGRDYNLSMLSNIVCRAELRVERDRARRCLENSCSNSQEITEACILVENHNRLVEKTSVVNMNRNNRRPTLRSSGTRVVSVIDNQEHMEACPNEFRVDDPATAVHSASNSRVALWKYHDFVQFFHIGRCVGSTPLGVTGSCKVSKNYHKALFLADKRQKERHRFQNCKQPQSFKKFGLFICDDWIELAGACTLYIPRLTT